MSKYPGYEQKLKRRLEEVSKAAEDLPELRGIASKLSDELMKEFKDSKENKLGVRKLEIVGAVPEGTNIHEVPEFDYLAMVPSPSGSRLSEPEPPMGQVKLLTKKSTSDVLAACSTALEFFKLLEASLSSCQDPKKLTKTFAKHTFLWQAAEKDTVGIGPLQRAVLCKDNPTGKIVFKCRFRVCVEATVGEATPFVLACADDHWRLCFDFKDRDRLSIVDKSDAGCRVTCLTLSKALLSSARYPELAALDSAAAIAKTLLQMEMKSTANQSTKWRQEFSGDRLIGMLEHLAKALGEKTLNHVFGMFMGGVNLLEGMADADKEKVKAALEADLKTPDKMLPHIGPLMSSGKLS